MTLRSRLALTYGVGLAVGLIVFAVLSIVTIDRTLRFGLDERLTTAARAAAAITDVKRDRIHLEADDRKQLASIFLGGISGAIVGIRQGIDFQTAGNVPLDAIPALPSLTRPRALDAGNSNDAIRVVAVPLHDSKTGAIAGASIAWSDDEWIGEVDRSAIAASGIVAAAIVTLALIFSGLLARRALSPLRQLSALAAEIEARDLSQRLDETGVDELARLCAAFNRMLDRLERAFKRQQRFTADASHEFRTPMAVIAAEADLALRRERSPDEYRHALGVIASEAARMEELVEALLDAARADEGTATVAPIDLRVAAEQVAERLEPSARAKLGTLRVCGSARPIVNVDRAGLTRALTAIVHNAIVHTPAQGHIDISVEHSAYGATIAVKDDGPGFGAEALEHATERFWRGDSAPRIGSTGLGLAIARALVEGNGGTLTLQNAPCSGAIVTISFPTARNPFIVP